MFFILILSENSAIKLAKKDILCGYQNGEYSLYSNQFIPLLCECDMLDRITLQGKFDSKCTGGAICHINIGTKIEDTQQIVDLVVSAAKQGVVYQW